MDTVLTGVLVLLSVGIVILAVLFVGRLKPSNRTDTTVQVELTRIAERMSVMERGQSAANQSLAGLGTSLAEVQAQTKARHELEQRTAGAIQRLESLMAGAQSKGAAGENMLEMALASLPAEWQVRDFRIGNKVVEFGLRLPDGRVLPIDSKWPATALVEELSTCQDLRRIQEIKLQIESVVTAKAREVKKYLDANLTTDYGIAVVPDAVYGLSSAIQVDLYHEHSVMLVSSSSFIPYLLLVFQTVLKASSSIDLDKLFASLKTANDSIRSLQEDMDGRLSKAITMLDNFRSDMRGHLGRLSTGLVGLQVNTNTSPPHPAADTSRKAD